MTVSSETSRKTFTGDAATTSFATSPMVFFNTSDLVVYVVTTATGASTTLTENTHYTVSGGDGSTGTVNLAGGSSPYGAPAATQTLVIVRDLPITQATDFVNNDGSDAEVQEDALDKLTMIAQQHATLLGRTFALADSDVSGASLVVPLPTADHILQWNEAGTALVNAAVTDLSGTVVTAFAATLLDDTTAAAARTTLGAVIGTDVQAYDADTAKTDVVQTFSVSQRGAVTALTSSGASIAVNLALSNNFSHTLTENTTLAAPTNVVAGQSGVITFTQHASSPKTLAYNSFWKFPGGTVPTLTASNSAVDVFTYFVNAAGYATCQLLKGIA